MKMDNAVGYIANNPVICPLDFEEMHRRRKETKVSENKDEAMRKVEEAKHATTQTTFKMVDRHIETVKKSQELAKEQARKRAIERMAQERKEEHSELLAEMAIRNAERRDLVEGAHLKKLRGIS